jgi:hypothetical protein
MHRQHDRAGIVIREIRTALAERPRARDRKLRQVGWLNQSQTPSPPRPPQVRSPSRSPTGTRVAISKLRCRAVSRSAKRLVPKTKNQCSPDKAYRSNTCCSSSNSSISRPMRGSSWPVSSWQRLVHPGSSVHRECSYWTRSQRPDGFSIKKIPQF